MAVCTSLGFQSVESCVSASRGEEMVEVRADISGFQVEDTVSVLKRIDCSKILTVRERNESGFLLKVLDGLEPGDVQYVDLELGASREYSEEVREAVHSLDARFIVSFHDFGDTPCLDELLEIYGICVSRGADIVKIVTYAADIEDASRVLQLYRSGTSEKPLVAFAMGEKGSFTRRLCLSLGAPFTYCAPDTGIATAPGQLTASEMRGLLSPASYPAGLNRLCRPGSAVLPCSKSFAQRAIILSALTPGTSILRGYCGCDDTEAALDVARAFGADVKVEEDTVRITGVRPEDVKVKCLDVGESALLARMLVPLSSLFLSAGGVVTVDGRGTLKGRILSDVGNVARMAGGEVDSEEGRVPLILREAVKNGNIEVDGSCSSQSISGLLMTLPLMKGDSILTVNHPVSIPYMEMTVRVLKKFGIMMDGVYDGSERCVFHIPGGQRYRPAEMDLEPDWSSAAYLVVASHIARYLRPGWMVDIPYIIKGTGQADERVLELVEICGSLNSFDFDATDCPDLFPIAAVLACFCSGTSVIKGVGRLHQKESDRAEAIFAELTILGARVSVEGDRMLITGGGLHGGQVLSHHDHRMVMALAVASIFIDGPVRIDGIDSISKSFPTFFSCMGGLFFRGTVLDTDEQCQ